MLLTYSRQSRPSAIRIAEVSDIMATTANHGTINWGKARANTQLNPDISKTTNKRVMRELFQAHGVPMPYLFTNNEDMGSGPLVGRPDHHTRGRGFWLCRTFDDVQRAMQGTHRKAAATHFMEYIDAPHEYRVHIFKGKSIRISEKAFGITGETAHGQYITIKPTGDVRAARKAAKKAVAAVGLDFGAVDVLADDEGHAWVLEVNAAPGLGGSMPKLYADTFHRWENGEFDD